MRHLEDVIKIIGYFLAVGVAISILWVANAHADGIDSDTVLMLHCDGVDESQVFTDDSASEHSMSVSGTNTKIDDAQFKWNQSGYWDGSDKLTTADDGDFTFGAESFTVDFWVYFSNQAADQFLVTTANIAGESDGWGIRWENGKITVKVQHATAKIVSTIGALNNNQWYHFAVVRDSSDDSLVFYLDGVNTASAAGVNDTVLVNNPLWIGVRNTGDKFFTGWMDEIRISKGVARWTANFDVPTEPYSEGGGSAKLDTMFLVFD